MFRIDEKRIKQRLAPLDSQLCKRLTDIKQSASRIHELHYLVFDIAPECSFKRFPVDLVTFDINWHPFDCSLQNSSLLNNPPLLEPKFDYPLGRHDWLGIDTTPDWHLVLNELATYIAAHWRNLEPKFDLPVAYVGHILDPYDFEDEPSELINIETGQKELIHCYWD